MFHLKNLLTYLGRLLSRAKVMKLLHDSLSSIAFSISLVLSRSVSLARVSFIAFLPLFGFLAKGCHRTSFEPISSRCRKQ